MKDGQWTCPKTETFVTLSNQSPPNTVCVLSIVSVLFFYCKSKKGQDENHILSDGSYRANQIESPKYEKEEVLSYCMSVTLFFSSSTIVMWSYMCSFFHIVGNVFL